MQALPARDQFANAISQLLAKKSISEIRVREICDGAQLSTRSFYNHFQDKYELASYALLKALQDVLKPFLSESEFESLDSIAPWAIAAQGTEESHRFNKAMVDFLVQNPHFSIICCRTPHRTAPTMNGKTASSGPCTSPMNDSVIPGADRTDWSLPLSRFTAASLILTRP